MGPKVASTASPHVCGSCWFWRVLPHEQHGGGWGQCRRMPPVPPPVLDDRLLHVGIWPHTDERDWCGEWRDAAEKPPTVGR